MIKQYAHEAKAQRVVISALGPAPVEVMLHGQGAVDYMISYWNKKLEPVLADQPDLIVLPEACNRFPRHSIAERKAYYEFCGDTIRDFFAGIAQQYSCYIAYSAARKLNDGSYRNSTQLIDRAGEVCGIYNKNHLVPCETTDGDMLCGKEAPVFETDFGRVAMAICFDLNYHELLEQYAVQHPDLIIFSSMYHGGLMQRHWAYHCRAHLVGAIANLECAIINPVGEKIAHSTNYYDYITTVANLDCKVVHLDGNWDKIAAAKHKYGRGFTIFDPGELATVLLTSELAEISIDEIIKEFAIETWDEYYARAMQHRLDNMEA